MDVLTIGHSTLPGEVFRGILTEHGCAMLVDIRTIPRSKHNPQFGQEALHASLEADGIGYRWMRELGGLRRPVPGSVNTAWRNTSFRGYADYMQTAEFVMALDALVEIAGGARTAIMCAEAVPWRCHRSLVGDALLARGVTVEDILYSKDARQGWRSERKPHRLMPFARVEFARMEGGRVWYPAAEPLFDGVVDGVKDGVKDPVEEDRADNPRRDAS
jgi:uncharacterized protein (DUF488 family)